MWVRGCNTLSESHSQHGHRNRLEQKPLARQMDQPLDFSVKSPGSPGGDSCYSHTSSRNKRSGSNGSIQKDEQYWIRREKNNQAAKRSRDARRQKEEQTKNENQILRRENEQLRYTVRTLEEHVRACPRHHHLNNGDDGLAMDG